MELLPKELKRIKQWTLSSSVEDLKRPMHTDYVHEGALTFNSALRYAGESKLIGFYTTPEDPYILIDIDHLNDPNNPIPELPIDLADMLRTYPTYMEVSPSGHGLRVIYKLTDVNKAEINGSYVKYKGDMGVGWKDLRRESQVNWGPPWQTITGNAIPSSINEVTDLPFTVLSNVYPVVTKQQARETSVVAPAATQLPPLAEIQTALKSIPLDQNPRIRRAYTRVFKAAYSHYDFWIKILMALHNYAEISGTNIPCLQMAIEWSSTDPVSYDSEDDVLKHWRSFALKDNPVSYKSLFGIAYANILVWPVPKALSKKEKEKNSPRRPLITEYVNFKAMVDYYGIEIFRDENNPNTVFVSGDQDVLSKYFMMFSVEVYFHKYYGPFVKDTLVPAFHIMMQQLGFIGVSHTVVNMFIKNFLAETRKEINLFRLYFDTPYDKLPMEYQGDSIYRESTTYEVLFSCLRIDHVSDNPEKEENLYKAYYHKWLMGLIRSLYYREMMNMNSCVLLLTGPEQIRKTSHFRYLLPPFMRDKIAFTTHGFSTDSAMRDVSKLASSNLIMVWDELEQFLNTDTESNFKKIIDGNPQKIIDKYEVVERIVLPIAIYGATSNLREFRLGDEGSRRLFHIPVSWIDTDAMQQICWHKLINDLKEEAEWNFKTGRVPWMLTTDQLEYQRRLHAVLRSKNSIDLILEEIFEFDNTFELKDGGVIPGVTSIQNDRTGRLLTSKDVNDVMNRAGYSTLAIKRPALDKSLERLCGAYSGTSRRKVHVTRPVCTVFRGRVTQAQFRKWLLPPLRKEIRQSMLSKFRDVIG